MSNLRPWAKMSPSQQIEAVRPLAADHSNSIIAFKLGAPAPAIAKIAAQIRREQSQSVEADQHAALNTAQDGVGANAPSTSSFGPVSKTPATSSRQVTAPRHPNSSPGAGEELRRWAELTPDEKRGAVKKLILEGFSYEKVSDLLGAPNRHCIAGVVSRLRGLGELPASDRSQVGREGNVVKKARKAAAPKPDRKPRTLGLAAFNIAVRAERRDDAPGITISRAAAFDPIPGVEPIPFISNTGFRWPVDGAAGKGLFVCGAPRGDLRSYCDAHWRLAHTPRQERVA